MTYVPGDNWIICDLSGKKVLMSQSRKTWDGLRVWAPLWYPRNPQDFLKGIPDRMNVVDGRPRPLDLYQTPLYNKSDICLVSPSGITYVVHVADDGALLVTPGIWGHPHKRFKLGQYDFTVDDDGALHVALGVRKPPDPWRLYSPSGIGFDVSVDTDLAVLVTQVASFPPYMEGVFTLISPNQTFYVVYIVDDMAVLVRPGYWGPTSSTFYLKNYKMTVSNDGALLVRASNEKHPVQHRMVSTGGYEYMWHVDPDGAVKIERQGHFWNVPVTLSVLDVEKQLVIPRFEDGTMDTTGAVAESGEDVWVEE